MNLGKRIIAAISSAVLILGAFSGCSATSKGKVAKDPPKAIAESTGKFVEKAVSGNSTLKTINNLTKGTATYKVEFDLPNGAGFELDMVANGKNGAFSGNLDIDIRQGLSTEVSAWKDKNNIAVNMPMLFGDDIYGVNLKTLAKDFDSSALMSSDAMDSGAEQFFRFIKGVLVEDKDAAKKYEEFINESKKILGDMEPAVAEEKISVGDTQVTAVSVEYHFDREDIAALRDAGIDYFDDIFGDFLYNVYGISLDQVAEEMDQALDRYENIATSDGSENAAASGVSGVFATIMSDLTVKTYMNKKTGSIVRIEASAGDIIDFEADFGADPSKLIDMSANFEVTLGDNYLELDASFKEIDEKDKDGFEAELSVYGNGGADNTIEAKFERNKKDGEFDFEISTDGTTVAEADGTLTVNKKSVVFELDSLEIDGHEADIDLKMSITSGGTIEKVPKYEEILNEDIEDLERMFEENSDLFG